MTLSKIQVNFLIFLGNSKTQIIILNFISYMNVLLNSYTKLRPLGI